MAQLKRRARAHGRRSAVAIGPAQGERAPRATGADRARTTDDGGQAERTGVGEVNRTGGRNRHSTRGC